MMIKNAQGQNKVKEGQENLRRIREWFMNNPDETQTKCAAELGFTNKTVCKYVKIIRNEG